MKDSFINRKYVIMALIVLATLRIVGEIIHYTGSKEHIPSFSRQ